ncbi:AraC family transcriptional regulator [Nibribacter koreensis]|uniref:HTH araC/xylS-type domain-containing protein n=1 Tax=Nibribacter koreensis TaxID=1084519 RepID=A0ABP8FGJ3_9BACT
MILTEFPDYQYLKARADKAFKEETAPNPTEAPTQKYDWPLVILNTHSRQCHRPDIKGPFSIFTNINGTSLVSAGSKKVAVPDDCFFLTNRAQPYTLDIDSEAKPVETFNLHLGQDIWEDYIKAQLLTPTHLLDNPFVPVLGTGVTDVLNLLQRKTPALAQALAQLHSLSKTTQVSALELEENLVPLLHALVETKRELERGTQRIKAAKASARLELFRRISLATDFLLAFPEDNPSLERIANIACLSKFHFLRAFTQLHGQTPHQFLLQHRIQRSLPLLRFSRLPVSEVGLLCGYSDLSTFSRTFRKLMGCSPALFRAQST